MDTKKCPDKNNFWDYYSYTNTDNQIILLRCNLKKLTPSNAKKLSPMCMSRGMRLKEGIYVTYFFRKSMLSQADQIETKVRELITGFEYHHIENPISDQMFQGASDTLVQFDMNG